MTPEQEPTPDGQDSNGEAEEVQLPEVAFTGAMPTLPLLLACIETMRGGNLPASGELDAIRQVQSRIEKKATMGAAIDLLIQARSNGDAAAMHNISQALWNVWHAFTYVDTEESDMVYGGHSTSPEMSDTPIRLWLELYNAYNVD